MNYQFWQQTFAHTHFSLKSVYNYIDQRSDHEDKETSDDNDKEIEEREETSSPSYSPAVQPSNETRKKRKKIEISPNFSDTDFDKSTVHSRMTIFGILYAGRNFIKVTSHQPHRAEFMLYLQTLISENPTWANDTGVEDLTWKELLSVLKAMWRKHKSWKSSCKSLKNFDISVGYSRTIYDSYLEFEK